MTPRPVGHGVRAGSRPHTCAVRPRVASLPRRPRPRDGRRAGRAHSPATGVLAARANADHSSASGSRPRRSRAPRMVTGVGRARRRDRRLLVGRARPRRARRSRGRRGCRAGSTSPGSPAPASARTPPRAAGSRSPTARRPRCRGGADLVVVEGGLNDLDRSRRRDPGRLRAADAAARGAVPHVVVVGPATAPARAARRCRASTRCSPPSPQQYGVAVRLDRRPRAVLPRRPAAPHAGRPPRLR